MTPDTLPPLLQALLLLFTFFGYGNSLETSASDHLPRVAGGGHIYDCESESVDGSPMSWPTEETAYLFGDVVRVEPILEGVRASFFGEPDTYLDDDTYRCAEYGHAALRVTFTNVEASWAGAPKDLQVDISALSLEALTSAPVIHPGTHELAWFTREDSRAAFPGAGTRVGMEVYGSKDGRITSNLGQTVQAWSSEYVQLRYTSSCVTFDSDKYSNEEAMLKELRSDAGRRELDRSQDRRWSVTSVCEFP